MHRNGPQSYASGGLPAKRQRVEDDYGRYSGSQFNGSSHEPPSRVLMVRNLKENVVEADLIDALSQFGPVSYVSLTGRGVALVEFEDIPAAERCVGCSMGAGISVLGQPASLSFSPLQIIPRQGWESDRPNNVVVMYVQNPKYPITTDVVNAICKPICNIVRIIVNRENGGVNCLVEFADIETAKNVKQRLNGCDIYSGCCTLKIEYAKLPRLNVTRNDQDQADYVTPPAALDATNFANAFKDRPALLQEPPVFTGGQAGQQFMGGDQFGNGTRNDLFGPPDNAPVFMGNGGGPMMQQPPFGEMPMPDGCGMGMENSVICIYGLDQEKINCDKLFNLLCQYGNVVRIKFLKSKADTVMVQMGDPVAAQRTIDLLNRTTLLGNKISISFSRQAHINEMRDSVELPDKTSSYKDFSNSRLNRFMVPEAAMKNRTCHPMKHLYFYHAPPHITPDELMNLMQDNEAPRPTNAKIFESKTGIESKSSAGILEFETEEDATDALVLCNHLAINHESSKFPFVVKLSFAAPNTRDGMGGGGRGRPPFGGRGGSARGGFRGSRGSGNGSFGAPSAEGGSFDPNLSASSDHGFRGGRGGRGRGDFRGGRGTGDFRGGRGDFRGRGRGGGSDRGGFRGRGRGRTY